MITVFIDGEAYSVDEGQTVLAVARENSIDIPTLCYHPHLRSNGACKLCAVEASSFSNGSRKAVLACTCYVSEGLEIRTKSPLIEATRAKVFKHLLRMAPQSNRLRSMAAEYGVHLGPPPDGCIRCGLCVRGCREIVGAGALKMKRIDGVDYVVQDPDRCIGCGTCAENCPTGAIRMGDKENLRSLFEREGNHWRVASKMPSENFKFQH